jgi:chromate reductase
MTNPTLGIIVGSNRRESINLKLAKGLAKLAADKFDVKFIKIDDLPMFNQDLESALPAPVVRFKKEVTDIDALLFVTPEHNRSMPAVLKNAIDWGTRPWGQNSWAGKVAMVTGASGSAVSTAVAQAHLRAILTSILGVTVSPGEAYINFKPDLIDDAGTINDESTAAFLQGFIDKLAVLAEQTASSAQKSAAA